MSQPHPITKYISPSTWALVEDKVRPHAKDILAQVCDFVENECMPAESTYHAQIPDDPSKRFQTVVPVMEELKAKAKARGLWNLFLSKAHYPDVGVDLTNVEYALMAEIMGRCGHIGPQAFNCSAPDTGNMEVLARYGTQAQKDKWLKPLMDGKIRSAFSMTERFVASSDATNIKLSIRKEGSTIIVNGHKWWISGSGDPRCKIHLVMGQSDPDNANPHKRQSIVLVPADTPGVKVVRAMTVFGYDDAPEGHCEVIYDNVRVPESNLIAGWGRGFEVIQGRLGPGRIHHCMRSIGAAERALDKMLTRVTDPVRRTFGKQLYEHGTIVADIAKSRMQIDQARLMVLSAANMVDKVRAKGALKDIGMSKVITPNMALDVLDRSMQAHGAEGISQDTFLAPTWAGLRTLRYADGPDEVHIQQIGKVELRRARELHERVQDVARKTAEVEKRNGVKAHL